MIDIMERIRLALQRHLNRSVKTMWRREWVRANHPDGRPVKLARPLPPLRGVIRTGVMETAVASARGYAEVPGTHIVRRHERDAPNIYNTDSRDVIEDLTTHVAWARVLQITGEKNVRNLRRRVRRRVFLVETRRADHHSPHVPKDIASAEPKDDASGPSGTCPPAIGHRRRAGSTTIRPGDCACFWTSPAVEKPAQGVPVTFNKEELMPTVVQVHQDAIDRLAAMGLDPETLRHAVEAGEMAADTCTDLDPPGFRGYTQWGVCTRELRMGLAPLKWTRRNRQNLPLAVSPDGLMCVTVATGDPATGIENATPQTKNPRGKVTRTAIMENVGQLSLFDGMERIHATTGDEPATLTWILLFHRDGDSVRCELSLPSAWDEDGRPSVWAERLILEPVGVVDRPSIASAEQEPEIDVEVERKNVREG